jgi:hypothetical protein
MSLIGEVIDTTESSVTSVLFTGSNVATAMHSKFKVVHISSKKPIVVNSTSLRNPATPYYRFEFGKRKITKWLDKLTNLEYDLHEKHSLIEKFESIKIAMIDGKIPNTKKLFAYFPIFRDQHSEFINAFCRSVTNAIEDSYSESEDEYDYLCEDYAYERGAVRRFYDEQFDSAEEYFCDSYYGRRRGNKNSKKNTVRDPFSLYQIELQMSIIRSELLVTQCKRKTLYLCHVAHSTPSDGGVFGHILSYLSPVDMKTLVNLKFLSEKYLKDNSIR